MNISEFSEWLQGIVDHIESPTTARDKGRFLQTSKDRLHSLKRKVRIIENALDELESLLKESPES